MNSASNQTELFARIDAVSGLAAGMAHDLGNLLLPLRMRLQSPSTEGEADRDQTILAQVTEHLQQIAGGLRLLSGAESEVRNQGTDVHSWWSLARPVLKSALPRGVALRAAISEDLPTAAVGRAWLTQTVFMILQIATMSAEPLRQSAVEVSAGAEGSSLHLDLKVESNYRSSQTERGAFRSNGVAEMLAQLEARCRSAGCCLAVRAEQVGMYCRLAMPVVHSTAGAKCRMRALVSIGDLRLATYMNVLLSSMGLDVEAHDAHGAPDREAHLWVSDDAHQVTIGEAQFRSGADRRIVILLTATSEPSSPDESLIKLSHTNLASLRKAIFEIVSSLEADTTPKV